METTDAEVIQYIHDISLTMLDSDEALNCKAQTYGMYLQKQVRFWEDEHKRSPSAANFGRYLVLRDALYKYLNVMR